jgi:HK97 family phage major capsid protein
MNAKLKELRAETEAKRAALAEIFEQAGPDMDMSKVTAVEGDSSAKVAHVRGLHDEINELAAQKEPLEAEHSALMRAKETAEALGEVDRGFPLPGSNGGRRDVDAPTKSLGELFVESVAYTGWSSGMKEGPVAELPNVDLMATLFETGAGWAPPTVRGPQVVQFATRPLRVADLLPQGQTTQASIVYMEETTYTNNAAETAEGLTKPEAVLALTERTEPVRKIAVTLPVTDEQLEDVPQVRSYIDNRMGFMVLQRLDGQIVAGDGIAPNLKGILGRTGLQTQAKGGDPTPDAIYKAMTKIQVNAFSEPNAAVFHPNDWQDIRLLRTADGIYIWGSPSDPGPERIWGLNVAKTTAMTENTSLVGDFMQAELVIRKGVSLSVGYVNDDFKKNRQTVRAEMRAALAVYRPAAFCQATGI